MPRPGGHTPTSGRPQSTRALRSDFVTRAILAGSRRERNAASSTAWRGRGAVAGSIGSMGRLRAKGLFSASSWSHNARRRSTRLVQIRLSQLRRSLVHEDGDHKTVQTRCQGSIVAGRTAVLNPVRRIVASHLVNNIVAWRERSCHGLSYSTSIRAHETKGSAA